MPETVKMDSGAKLAQDGLSGAYRAFSFTLKESGVAFVTIDAPDAKVNVLTAPVMRELNDLLLELSQRTDIKALVFISGKETNFVAGADLAEIAGITDPQEGAAKARAGQEAFQKIEDMPFPVIAAIQGTCLGGGLEMALACHFRIAKVHPQTRMGLPEVKLGILPGFGGTQRLPRLIGIEKALGLILTGKMVDANKAGRLGLVDKVLPVDHHGFMKAEAEEFARSAIDLFKRGVHKKARGQSGLLGKLIEGTAMGRAFLFDAARKRTLRTTRGHYPAPLKALQAVKHGFEAPRVQGFENEAKLLGELIVTDVSKNLISLFHLSETLKKDPGVEKPKSDPREIKNVHLIGAGVMGGGIAQLLAFSDIPVRMKDINQNALDLGFSRAREIFQSAVDKRKMTAAEVQRKMTLVTGALDYSGFSISDFVIEAIIENMDVKKQVFSELEREVPDATILATNTSSLSITEIASAVKKPERVIGFHFFNPVHRMPLVEIIRGDKTSDETTVTAVEFAKRLGKTPIVVKNSPGFLVNRILGPYINEGALLLEDGATIEEIDKAMLDFGMPMGPLNLLDEVGIDVGHKVAKILRETFGERVEVSSVIEKVSADGRLGKKGGKGFYIYEGKKKRVDPEVYRVLRHVRRRDALSRQDIQDRLVSIMLKEAILCLEEGIVRRSRDVDAGLIFGTGFPPFRGGLLRYADNLGPQQCVDLMSRLTEQVGPRFEPPKYLVSLAKKNSHFYETN